MTTRNVFLAPHPCRTRYWLCSNRFCKCVQKRSCEDDEWGGGGVERCRIPNRSKSRKLEPHCFPHLCRACVLEPNMGTTCDLNLGTRSVSSSRHGAHAMSHVRSTARVARAFVYWQLSARLVDKVIQDAAANTKACAQSDKKSCCSWVALLGPSTC